MSDTLEIYGKTWTGVTSLNAYDNNDNPMTYIRPMGTKSISSNGNAIDVTQYAAVNVSVSGGAPTLQSTAVTFTPSTVSQASTVTAGSGYDGLEKVGITVDAVPWVEFDEDDGVVLSYDGRTGNLDINLNIATPGYMTSDILQVQSFSGITNISDTTYITPSTAQQVAADYGTFTGGGQIIINAMPSGTAGIPTASKGSVSNNSISVTPSVTNTSGYIEGGTKTGTAVTVSASELVSSTYSVNSTGVKDVTTYKAINVPSGTEGTPTASKGSVSNHAISVTPSVTNTGGYISGGTKTGTAVSVAASELVSSTYTVNSTGTVDVTNYKAISVSAGSAGTPTATKGTVSNHSISVTPSVTNTGGYISGGTKTGTAVSVSASELVSGTLEVITNETTINCANYSSVSVAIPFVTYYTGSSTPSGSLGSNNDLYLKVVS